jgi:hypothetical protein
MKRFLLVLALASLVFTPRVAGAPTIIGDLNNFDTVNDTGQICYGFEIEIDGIHSTDVTYTFDWNHYGAPKIREDNTDPALPRVFVRYESTKDASGVFGANGSFTNVAIPSISPPQGHSCTDTSVNEGCEHFGVGYYGTPATIKYNWLVDSGAGSLVYQGTPVSVATPTWQYTPPVAGQPAQVVAAIPAPVVGIPPGKEFGEPSWVKVIKTTTHSANPVALADLVSADKDNDGRPDWTNGEPDEVESEWYLLQPNTGANNSRNELAGNADDMGNGSEVVTRRYEFYKYGAGIPSIDGETGEAMCSEVNPTLDTNDPNYLHGIGVVTVTDANGNSYTFDCGVAVVVGNYIGAQMAGFAAGAPLGLIDHLQDGESGVVYVPRTVVVGGNPPYTVSIPSGSLPTGLSVSSGGVLSGTPASGGDFTFTLAATDTDAQYVSLQYSLHIVDVGAPRYDLNVQLNGSGTGTVSGNGISCAPTCSASLDGGTAISLTAFAGAGSIFSGWTGLCTGTGICGFTLNAATTVTATFTKQWQLSVSTAGTGTGIVTGGVIDCGATCSALVDDGTAVTLSATPTNGSVFTGWTGACTGTGSCAVTMNAAYAVTATFASPTQLFTLSVVPSGAGSGTVTSSPKGLNCGKRCSDTFTVGTVVTLTAKPARKHTFGGWSGACASAGSSLTCTLPLLKDETVGVVFN